MATLDAIQTQCRGEALSCHDAVYSLPTGKGNVLSASGNRFVALRGCNDILREQPPKVCNVLYW